ncbi:MAG: cytochrome C, partial [Pseudomonadota bacterium]|nr:cytochrome C [Pseudomonadota bacterium]
MPRRTWILAIAILGASAWSSGARALPSFAQQTGQACSKCHVGGYGPQLKQYGRDFKLYAYVNGDKMNHLPPISITTISSFTNTQADAAKTLPHFEDNDNIAAAEKVKLAYAGALPGNIVGSFSEVSYDGVRRVLQLDNVDIRTAVNPTILGRDVVLGLDLNDRPTVQDLWNSTPTFELVPLTSALAPLPAASAIIDAKLAQRVVGGGAYGEWNNWLHAEVTAYRPLQNNIVRRMGLATPANADVYDGAIPYWRVALQHDLEDSHYFEIGAYGLSAQRLPTGVRTRGDDRITDTAADATYQFTGG